MKRVILAGLLGSVVFAVWFVIVDGLLGFNRAIEMGRLADERAVYAFLVEHVTEPGRYVVNPEVSPDRAFPGDDPVFAVQFSGLGHADAGQEMLVGLVVMLLTPFLGAWLLSNASTLVLSRYGSRLLFFSLVGLVFALFLIMTRFGLARYPLGDALALSVHDLAAWIAAGLVVAWFVRPTAAEGTARPG
ncbi:MAG: hypothetical protein PVJ43_14955 [Gemmatimonadales bacterium]